MKENIIKDRSFELAVEIVFVYQYLTGDLTNKNQL